MQRIVCLITFILLSINSGAIFAVEYKVAVRAHHGVKSAIKQWQPTVDFLNKRIPEHHFKLIPILSLKLISQGAQSGSVDFVLTNPSSYVEIHSLSGAKALATLNNKRGKTSLDQFGSVIFTRNEDNKISDLDDIKGKTLMVVSERAFGGWRVAWLEMLEEKFLPKRDLKKLLFAKNGTQPEVVWAVFNHKVDVGVVRTDLLERMTQKGNLKLSDFRVLNQKKVKGFPFKLSTRLYPEWAFSVLTHVPDRVASQVKKVLRSIKTSQSAATAGKYAGWIEPLDYSSVDKLMKRLKVGHYK